MPPTNQTQSLLNDLIVKLINFQVNLIKNVTLYRETINEKPEEFIELVAKDFGQLVGDKLAKKLIDNSIEFDGNMVDPQMDIGYHGSN